MATAAGLTDPEGTIRPTIFAEMSALAAATGAVNLGQGFPDSDGPAWIREAAITAIREGANQYPPGRGIASLRQAIAAHQFRHYGLTWDPESQVLVTAGATEALTAAVLALAGPGDEVLTLEPFYDSHAAAIALAGATHTTAPLVAAADGFRLDIAALERAVTPQTRLILINTPHNPTGTVLTSDELSAIAAVAVRVDALVVTDEVYEHLTYDGVRHVPFAMLPGMAERTITISSAGKTFSLTGWKIGWATGPAHLVEALLTVKQFLTYSGGAPFQPAIARALNDGSPDIDELSTSLQCRRDLLVTGLREAGFAAGIPQGTYFVCADAAHLLTPDLPDGAALARALPHLLGGGPITIRTFCHTGSATATALSSWLRFTFVKDEETIRRALLRLSS